MEKAKLWISWNKNRYKVPVEDMNLVLHEMIAKDIGLRGSNVFTVTYPFLAAV